jgi:hypothetical protein
MPFNRATGRPTVVLMLNYIRLNYPVYDLVLIPNGSLWSLTGGVIWRFMEHDSKDGERLAGWFHLGFAVMYIIAIGWHIRSTFEHWNRYRE